MRDALEGWIATQRGAAAGVAELRRIATGHSRGNWFLELTDGTRYVVRIEQGGVFGSSGAEEFRFMQAAGRLGCSVARVRWLEETGDVIGQPFFVMDFIEGAAPGDPEDRSLAPDLARDYVRRLHELHEVDWRAEIETEHGAEGATHAQIERWADIYRAASSEPVPLLEEAAAWLHRHAPPLDRMSLVHADPGPGNFVHDGERVIAFTDWEFSHLGDPMEDWVFLTLMRGARTMPREAWLALFEREVGVVVRDVDLRYWGAFNFFKGACANRSCLTAFAGANPAPNMAMIGTVLHQTFLRQVVDLVASTPDAT